MYFIQLWVDNRALSKILCSTIPVPVHDLKIKVTDFEFFCVKSLQCQLLQSVWLIWIMFGMNGYKMFQKGKACLRRAALSGDRLYLLIYFFIVQLHVNSVHPAQIYLPLQLETLYMCT